MSRERNRLPTEELGVEVFGRKLSVNVTLPQMEKVREVILNHKKGFYIATTLGLISTAAIIYRRELDRESQQSRINSAERLEIFRNSVPLTHEEASSFETFFTDNALRAIRLARNKSNRFSDDSQEIASKAFASMLEHWPEYKNKEPEELRKILFTTILHLELNNRRSLARKPVYSIDNPNIAQSIYDIETHEMSIEDKVILKVDGSQLEQHVVEAIFKFFEEQPYHRRLRTILNIAGLDQRSIGYILGENRNTAKQAWLRIRRSLKDL